MPFGPVGIHAVEHFGPVLRLGTARARMEGDDGVAAVVFSGQQGGETLLVEGGLDTLDAGRALLEQGQIPFLVGQGDEREGIVLIPQQPFVPFDPVRQKGGALGDLLGGLHIVPKAVGGGLHREFFRLPLHLRQTDGPRQIVDLGIQPFQPLPQFFKL